MAKKTEFLIGSLGTLASVVALTLDHPIAAIAILLTAVAAIVVMYALVGLAWIREMRAGLKHFAVVFKNSSYQPDLVIAFSRTGAFFAQALAIHLGIEEIMVLPRRTHPERAGPDKPIPRDIGIGLKLDGLTMQARFPLLVEFHADTSETLQAALKYLREQGVRTDTIPVVSLYVTPSFARDWPHVRYYKAQSDKNATRSRLPWILRDRYPHV